MLFNASERKGIFLLILLITSTILLPRHFLANEPDFFLIPAEIQGDSIQAMPQVTSPEIQKVLPLKKKINPQTKIELNSVDSNTLVKIRGIGPYYASKIIRYRKQLGGFYSVNQLKELKMKYFNVDSNAHLFSVTSNLIQVRDLDTMSFKSLVHHPYLEYEDVQMIFEAKRKYGHLTYDTLEIHGVLTIFKLKKIKPYFK